jgi:PAS domain S-box-containing protein
MDGGGWVSTHDDCTEERRMQRVLERTERFLVTVVENVAEAIAAKDARSLRYVFVNRAAEKLFELPRASIIGKTAREIFPVEIADMIERGDRHLIDGNEQLEAMVHVVETPAGRRIRAVRRVPIRGPDGESRVFLSRIEPTGTRRPSTQPLPPEPSRAEFRLQCVNGRANRHCRRLQWRPEYRGCPRYAETRLPQICGNFSARSLRRSTVMFRKTVLALLAVAVAGLLSPGVASARGGPPI